MSRRLIGFFVSLSFALAAFAIGAQAQPAPVKNIVLVHGAWADGSGWRGVYDELTERGFSVSIVQNPLTSLADDVAATRRVLERQDGPVILVAHSYGGMVITEAGTAENVVGLVYVSAFVPDAGESVTSMIKGGGLPPVQPSKDGFLFFDPAAFPGAFAQDLPADEGAFLAISQVPIAAVAFDGVITEPAWKGRPAWHVIATEDHIVPPDAQRAWAKRAGSTIIETPGSHATFISQPKVIADAIETAAKAVAK
jgi:pimeloyl-ACP methyl ester carboxylesterase